MTQRNWGNLFRSAMSGRPIEPFLGREAVMKLLQWLYAALLALSTGVGSFFPI